MKIIDSFKTILERLFQVSHGPNKITNLVFSVKNFNILFYALKIRGFLLTKKRNHVIRYSESQSGLALEQDSSQIQPKK